MFPPESCKLAEISIGNNGGVQLERLDTHILLYEGTIKAPVVL